MVSSDQMVSDVPSCKNKVRKRRKHKSDGKSSQILDEYAMDCL